MLSPCPRAAESAEEQFFYSGLNPETQPTDIGHDYLYFGLENIIADTDVAYSTINRGSEPAEPGAGFVHCPTRTSRT